MKELNVIEIIPKERHPLIFSTFDAIAGRRVLSADQ